MSSIAPGQYHGAWPAHPAGELVPVTLRLEYKGRRIADKFLWDSGDGRSAVADFSRIFCQDHGLHPGHAPTLAAELTRQVGAWMSALPAPREDEKEPELSNLQTIRLDCVVGHTRLQDQFLWDMSVRDPGAPETFAMDLCRDLGLRGAWALELAVSLRHQLALAARRGPPGVAEGRPSPDHALERPAEEGWGPRLTVLSREEVAALAATRGEGARRAAASQNGGASTGAGAGPGGQPPIADPGAVGPRQLRKRRGTRLAALVSSELEGQGDRVSSAPPGPGQPSPGQPGTGPGPTRNTTQLAHAHLPSPYAGAPARRFPSTGAVSGLGPSPSISPHLQARGAGTGMGRGSPNLAMLNGGESLPSHGMLSGSLSSLGMQGGTNGTVPPQSSPPPAGRYANLFADMF